jgi:predicted membrane channel-forming protein YqfA (hemolysin III family)
MRFMIRIDKQHEDKKLLLSQIIFLLFHFTYHNFRNLSKSTTIQRRIQYIYIYEC